MAANAQVNYKVQTACHPQDVKHYDTELLRSRFMMDKVMAPDEINVTYTLYDRLIYGGAMPVNKTLKLEVFQGKPKKKQVVFTLANSLTIGSSASCDIVWNDPEMDGVCARIFLDEQGVFIESVSPRTQVFVEGILIHGPNRLRSGDRVTIAHSTFCLRF